MKNQRMLDTGEAVVPGTEGGHCPPRASQPRMRYAAPHACAQANR
jgi:hypothetical protein